MAFDKKQVLIFGATGMLGSAVYNELKDKYGLILSVRSPSKIELLDKTYGGAASHKVVEFDANRLYEDYANKKGFPGEYMADFLQRIGRIDYVINALGVTIPFALANPALTFFINSALPHILAGIFGKKLIHITTDCVFNGKDGFPYDERSPKTPVDIYGLSKSLGEPLNCLTLRTSIVGRELDGFTGLLEWFLQQKGKTLKGFANHFWNGVTTKQFAKICDQIMSHPDQYPEAGIYHAFSNTVSKYDMLLAFREKYNLDCAIEKEEEQKFNRTLTTIYDLNEKLKIPSFAQMVLEL